MKNKKLTIVTLLLTGTLLFAGCGQTSSSSNKASSEKQNTSTEQTAATEDTLVNSKDTKSDNVFSNMSTTDLDGNAVDSSIFKEYKLTLVNVWNIGCTPCIEELPALDKLNQEYAEKGVSIKGLYFSFGEDIQDDEMKQITDALSNANASYQQLFLNADMYATDTMQSVMAFPTTFIVDSNGNIIDKLEGSNDYDGWKEIIEKYLVQVE